VDVTSTSKVPTYTAWAATTDCANAVGCTSALFSLAPTTSGTNAVGSIVSLPWTPNSMMFNHASSPRLYIGSDVGLMYVDVTAANPAVTLISNSTTPCNVALCGKVLAISNDGKQVVISDRFSTPNQVYIFDGGGTSPPVDLVIPGDTATAAAFSPDQLKLFILTSTGKMYVHSTVDALTSVSVGTSVTDVKFSADGSFAYVAGAPSGSVSAYSTCSLPDNPSVDIGNVAASSTPLQLFPLPNVQADSQGLTQTILALEPPNVEFLTAQQFTQVPIQYHHPLQLTCNPPTIQSFTKGGMFDLGQGGFIPVYTQLVADGSELIVVARNIPAVLLFNVSSGVTSSVPLVGNTDPLSASASTDGSQVYIAACDQYDQTTIPPTCTAGSVHIVNTCGVISCNIPPTIGQGDFQQVPYVNINDANNPNMCNNQGGTNPPLCLPNLVAIRPQ
jgi:DNA-binding beta-propeller fold protein YncE